MGAGRRAILWQKPGALRNRAPASRVDPLEAPIRRYLGQIPALFGRFFDWLFLALARGPPLDRLPERHQRVSADAFLVSDLTIAETPAAQHLQHRLRRVEHGPDVVRLARHDAEERLAVARVVRNALHLELA